MPIKVLSSGILGIDAHPIDVEVDVAPGAYGYELVGLPDTAVRESKQRVKSAIRNAAFQVPQEKVVINLSPADFRKEGTAYDLPIAVGILAASRQARGLPLDSTLFVGELSLSGDVRPVRGILATVLAARGRGIERVVVPRDNGPEAAAVEGVDVIGVASLREAVDVLEGRAERTPVAAEVAATPSHELYSDLRFVKGQKRARRALEIAAAGGHHLLMVGPPGAGKTLLSRCLPGLLPDLSMDERLEVSRIYSAAGLLHRGHLLARRPFRAPHHTSSAAAVVGGGSGSPRPGEISLAHLGVLFLDEFPEFARPVREVLREPLESGEVTISRARASVRFPARFQLVATMNPCPCGYFGISEGPRACSCHAGTVQRYAARLSGPLADRLDLRVVTPPVPRQMMLEDCEQECSDVVRARVSAARVRQRERLGGTPFYCNASVTGAQLEAICRLDNSSRGLMGRMMERNGLSARGFHRVVRVARTIADLAASAEVAHTHIAEALTFKGYTA